MGLEFYKMSGLGNDFILIDNFEGRLKEDPADLARRLCPRRTSVGADGLVVLEPDDEVDFRWRFHNSDGSEAEMCGNASRCAARLAVRLGRAGEKLAFRTLAGIIRAEVSGDRVKVELPRPERLRRGVSLALDGASLQADFIVAGVPHAVVLVEDLEAVDVAGLGAKIRYHAQFAPAGTNADFISLLGPDRLGLRTYERGVEGETLACGTGAVASAVLAHLRGLVASPTRVRVRSGEELVIHYAANPEGLDPWPGAVLMEGQATLVYQAELSQEV